MQTPGRIYRAFFCTFNDARHDSQRSRRMKQGLFGYLTEPFDHKGLLAEIECALALGGSNAPQSDSEDWRAAITTRNPVVESVLAIAWMAAANDASVLVYGDSGTARELLAQVIHKASTRRDGPFVRDQLRRDTGAVARVRIIRPCQRRVHARGTRYQGSLSDSWRRATFRHTHQTVPVFAAN